MANDNNNINILVDESDDDPTAELEVLSESLVAAALAEGASNGETSESDDTGTFHTSEITVEGDRIAESISAVRPDTPSKSDKVGRLQLDIEQLRSKWSGLEREISAREVLTDKVNKQLAETEDELRETMGKLSARNSQIEELKSRLDDHAKQLAAAAEELSSLKNVAGDNDRELTKREQQIAEKNERIKTLISEKDEQVKALVKELEAKQDAQRRAESTEQELNNQLSDLQKRLAETKSSLADLRQYVDGRKSEWDKLMLDAQATSEALSGKEAEIGELSTQIRDQAKTLQAAQRETELLSKKITSQKKDLQSVRSENRKLKKDIRKDTEGKLEASRQKRSAAHPTVNRAYRARPYDRKSRGREECDL